MIERPLISTGGVQSLVACDPEGEGVFHIHQRSNSGDTNLCRSLIEVTKNKWIQDWAIGLAARHKHEASPRFSEQLS